MGRSCCSDWKRRAVARWRCLGRAHSVDDINPAYLKDPKLWEFWYIPYYGSCRIYIINRNPGLY